MNDSKQDYLSDFFVHAPIGFHAFGPDRRFIDINQTELDMLGYRRNEIVGKKTWLDLIVPAEIPLFEKHWQDITTQGEVRNLNYTLVRKDGRQLKVLLNASARFDKAGKLINTRGSVVDITERYQLARTLAVSKKKLSQHKLALQKNSAILLGWLDKGENERRASHKHLQISMEKTIFPLVERLKRRSSSLDRRNLMLLENYLQDLAGGFSFKVMDKKWRLSAREIEICRMLKNDLKTKDIADLLCTSERTIEHHRNHIRKKLGIDQRSVDLTAYLKEFSL